MYKLNEVLTELKNKCLVNKNAVKLISDETKEEIKLSSIKDISEYLVVSISINDLTQQYELRIKEVE